MLVTLKIINSQQKTSKAGKPYTSVGIQVAEFGDTWINGFGSNHTAKWNRGDKVDLDIYDESKNGRVYKNFKLPDKNQAIEQRVEKLEKQMAFLAGHLGLSGTWITPQNPVKAPVAGFDTAFQNAYAENELPLPF
jgi:hypothetical protein